MQFAGGSAWRKRLRHRGGQAIIGEPVKKPSPGALLLGLIPFAAMCFSVPLWDRIDPMILGVPFNLAWLICWIVLSSVCMWAAYRVEAARDKKDGGA
jgi:hypothetical protein